MPKRPQKIEIEKEHPDLLRSLIQAVKTKCPNFLGTALMFYSRFLDITIPKKPRQESPLAKVGSTNVGSNRADSRVVFEARGNGITWR